MKKITLFLSLFVAVIASLSFINSPPEELKINAAIPQADYKMKDVSGKSISLNDAKTTKGLLVIFSCNTCPYVKLSETRIKEYSDYCLANGIGCAIINSNEGQRSEEDSFDEMVKYFAAQQLKCTYAVDEKSQLANAFGATRTPQCFLFNAKGLIYKGAIDDNVKDPSAVKAPYLKDALTSLVKNETPKMQETKSIGCTIKRLE
ncbi:redoxin family protein [Sediminibacterium sp.]|uniref:redoxin family protein n=1 Tax=Sediminibacterium sp. TaxID=1917865 RepID=UPI0027159ACB|nr:redoxin family protein [Sediminibacterium sp.]MDO9000565.1 redoxin family protein [Bacteroidota bacterium]MDP3146867.1 redoxin family protein [Bacteroidota bacterium]MDP3567587.1 redoxin family protein [Sediminibacterium sp.]